MFFEMLDAVFSRPRPFERYTARELWTDPHTSERMLAFHLNADVDVASRSLAFIERSVDWTVSRFGITTTTRTADFGCGPGLYANRLAKAGAAVTGIDFSPRSIEYARQSARKDGLAVRYVNENYLDFETDERFELVLMIMCDFCALSPAQRNQMLKKFHRFLAPGGHVLLDVYSLNAFGQREETVHFEKNLMDGFWSAEDYYAFLSTFRYEEEKVVLDKYTIIEAARTRTIYNWLQYFSPEALTNELAACGFAIDEILADVAGTPFCEDRSEFAVVASNR